MTDVRKRIEELEKYFESYANGEFDESDELMDELSMEYSDLIREYNQSIDYESQTQEFLECKALYEEGMFG